MSKHRVRVHPSRSYQIFEGEGETIWTAGHGPGLSHVGPGEREYIDIPSEPGDYVLVSFEPAPTPDEGRHGERHEFDGGYGRVGVIEAIERGTCDLCGTEGRCISIDATEGEYVNALICAPCVVAEIEKLNKEIEA